LNLSSASATGTEFEADELAEGLVDDVDIVVQVGGLGLDIEHAGHDLAGQRVSG
jgi:hypothetical protein